MSKIIKFNLTLEKNSITLLIVLMVGNILNYLFQIIMGWRLSIEDYGILNSLFSIIAILSVLSAVITMSSAAYTVEAVINKPESLRGQTMTLLKITAGCSLFLVGIGWAMSDVISDIFKLEDAFIVVITVVIVSFNLFAAIILGTLQGLQRFFHFGMVTLVSIIGKFVFGLIFVTLELGLYGVLTAIFIGYVISIIYGFFQIRHIFISKDNYCKFSFDAKQFFNYISRIILVQVCINIMTNGDMLLVKVFFTSKEAGVYSSAMVIGKITLYVAMAIVSALFPMVAEQKALRNSPKTLLYKSLLYAGGISLCGAIGISIFSGFIISFLFGDKYAGSAVLLLPVSIYVLPVTLFTVLMNYQLAMRKTRMLGLSLIGSIVCSALVVVFFHSTISQMIYSIAIVLCIGAAANIVYIAMQKN